MKSDDIELSVIILCYRSEKAIIDFANKTEQLVKQLTNNYEIVLVGNYTEGSDDSTKEIVSALAKENLRFKAICKPKKGMMGWDMKEGLKIASGNYLCVIDGDGQFPLDSIKRCYDEIKTNKYDLVKTYRNKRNDGAYRKLISKSYNLLFAVLFPGLRSKDVNSKPKILTRKAYEAMDLVSDDWFVDAEIMLNIRSENMTFFEFPIEFY